MSQDLVLFLQVLITNDGDQDLITVVLNVPQNVDGWETKVYKNEVGQDQNWLQVELEGILANKDAIGATVSLFADDHSTIQEINGGNSHCSHNSKILHFGLDSLNIIDSLKITWPSRSKTQIITELAINQRTFVLEDTTGTFINMDTMVIDTMHMDTMNMDTTLSILDLDLSDEVQLSPTPTSQFFSIQSERTISGYSIFDLEGRALREERFIIAQKSFARNVYDLNDGFYLVILKTTDGNYVQKKLIVHKTN